MKVVIYGLTCAGGFLAISIWLFAILEVWLTVPWASKVYGTTFFLGLASWTVAFAAFAVWVIGL